MLQICCWTSAEIFQCCVIIILRNKLIIIKVYFHSSWGFLLLGAPLFPGKILDDTWAGRCVDLDKAKVELSAIFSQDAVTCLLQHATGVASAAMLPLCGPCGTLVTHYDWPSTRLPTLTFQTLTGFRPAFLLEKGVLVWDGLLRLHSPPSWLPLLSPSHSVTPFWLCTLVLVIHFLILTFTSGHHHSVFQSVETPT